MLTSPPTPPNIRNIKKSKFCLGGSRITKTTTISPAEPFGSRAYTNDEFSSKRSEHFEKFIIEIISGFSVAEIIEGFASKL